MCLFYIDGLFSDLFYWNFDYLLYRNRNLDNMLDFFCDNIINKNGFLNKMLNRNLNLTFYNNFIGYRFLNNVFDVHRTLNKHFNVFINRNFNRNFDFFLNNHFNRNRAFNNLFYRTFNNTFYGNLDNFLNIAFNFFGDDIVNINWFLYKFVLMNIFDFCVKNLSILVVANITFIDILIVFTINDIFSYNIIRNLNNTFIRFVYVNFILNRYFDDFFNWNLNNLLYRDFKDFFNWFLNNNFNDFLTFDCSFNGNIYNYIVGYINNALNRNWNLFHNFNDFFFFNSFNFLSLHS